MKQLSTVISGFALLLFVSCGSSENKETKAETPAVNNDMNTSATQPASNSVISTAPAATTKVVPTTNSIPVINTPPVTTTNSNEAGLNPAHGQPGHRCDISVGAPLNSAPRSTTTPTVSTTTTAPATLTPSIVNTSPQVVTTPTTVQPVAAGMNPAHGQPGHRCDITVGAPLNSPVKPTVTPTTPVKQ
ncbi:MAG: hypothetical protein SGI83_06050 [Bacteroidota bacterium]|nr:hypothetical protein [Bacteroidota bacterium]